MNQILFITALLIVMAVHSSIQLAVEPLDNACLYANECLSSEVCVSYGGGKYACYSPDTAPFNSNTRMLSAKKSIDKKAAKQKEELAIPSVDDSDEEGEEKKVVDVEEDDVTRKVKGEKQLSLINMPSGFDKKYLNFDPCISSPCLFGKICHKMDTAPAGFLCLNELDHSAEISDARKVYRAMELLAKEAVVLNMNTMATKQLPMTKSTPRGFSTNLKASKKLKKNPCLSNPCTMDELCEFSQDSKDGFICTKQNKTIIKDENDNISRMLNDEKFVEEMIQKCRKVNNEQRQEVEKHPSMFVQCLGKEEFTVVNCPDGLVFNKHLDRCDVDLEPMALGCRSSPCQFGSTCIDLPGLDYKCKCANGFSGVNCEIGPDVCSTKPCGSKGFCHAQPPTAPIAYYCSCADGNLFGLNCDDEKTLEKNPCDDVDSQNALFPTNLDPSVFVHCDLHTFHLRYCQKGKQLDRDDMNCKWIDMSSERKSKGQLKKLVNRRYI